MNAKDTILIAKMAVAADGIVSDDVISQFYELVERTERVHDGMRRELASKADQLKNMKADYDTLTVAWAEATSARDKWKSSWEGAEEALSVANDYWAKSEALAKERQIGWDAEKKALRAMSEQNGILAEAVRAVTSERDKLQAELDALKVVP